MADLGEGPTPPGNIFLRLEPPLSECLDQPLLRQAYCEFVLFHYSYPLTLSTVGESNWSRIPRDHIQAQKGKKNLVMLIYVFQ